MVAQFISVQNDGLTEKTQDPGERLDSPVRAGRCGPGKGRSPAGAVAPRQVVGGER